MEICKLIQDVSGIVTMHDGQCVIRSIALALRGGSGCSPLLVSLLTEQTQRPVAHLVALEQMSQITPATCCYVQQII